MKRSWDSRKPGGIQQEGLLGREDGNKGEGMGSVTGDGDAGAESGQTGKQIPKYYY